MRSRIRIRIRINGRDTARLRMVGQEEGKGVRTVLSMTENQLAMEGLLEEACSVARPARVAVFEMSARVIAVG